MRPAALMVRDGAAPAPGSPSAALGDLAQRLSTGPQPAAACRPGDGTACGLLRQAGLGAEWARTLSDYGDTGLRILLVVVGGVTLRWLLQRAITQLSERIASGGPAAASTRRRTRPLTRRLIRPWTTRTPASTTTHATAHASAGPADPTDPGATAAPPGGTVAWERRAQRARTVGSVLSSLTTGVVTVTVVLLVLGEVGFDLAPLLAGAGVVGVAVGFGCQTLVKDFLSGIFLIAEDQYGVGDVVDLGGASGTVEAVGLRVTRLRSVEGTVWYVRNGEVLRVGNKSQGWARAVLDVDVPRGEDVARARGLLAEVATDLFDDPEWAPLALEAPEVWGVEALTADAVVVRLVVTTVPLQQWKVARELRERIKARFDAEGVGPAAAQRTVLLRSEAAAPAAPGTATPAPAPALPRQVAPGAGADRPVDVRT